MNSENCCEPLNIHELLREIKSLDEEGKNTYNNLRKERQEQTKKGQVIQGKP